MADLNLVKFTLDASVPDEPTPLLGGAALDVLDIGDDGRVIAECDQSALSTASFDDFPNGLTVEVRTTDGFGTYLFHDVEVCRDAAGQLVAKHVCHHPNKYWEGTWGLAALLAAIRDQLQFFEAVTVQEIDLQDDWKRLVLCLPIRGHVCADALQRNGDLLKKIIREAEIALGGIRWKPEYSKDERVFCEEVLGPLLRRMKFLSVRYTQGPREYGKDFTFSELTPFGFLRHYGLQAKAGDVSGEVNSAIDELVGQADDAFKMPFYDIASAEPRYISTFVIAISGRFTSSNRSGVGLSGRAWACDSVVHDEHDLGVG